MMERHTITGDRAMTIRHLVTRPFRHYADFSGRSGRAEYWLLILIFVVVTEVAWLIGFGGMRLAGYAPHDHSSQLYAAFERMGDSPEHRPDLNDIFDKDDESHVIFKLHQHDGEGWHLHGSIRPWQHDRDEHRMSGTNPDDTTQDGKGQNNTGEDGTFYFHHEYDDKTDAEDGAEILEFIAALVMLVPILAAGARRLHDSGKSGWWQLFVLIPVAGWVVLVIFLLLNGDPKNNRFGPPASD